MKYTNKQTKTTPNEIETQGLPGLKKKLFQRDKKWTKSFQNQRTIYSPYSFLKAYVRIFGHTKYSREEIQVK